MSIKKDGDELNVFDNVVRSLKPYRKKRRYVWALRAAGALIFTVFLLLLGRAGIFGDGLEKFLGGGHDGVEITETSSAEQTESETKERIEGEETAAFESESEDLTETAETEIATEPVSVDMSQAEKGNGYIVNRTDWRPDTNGLLDVGFWDWETGYGEAPVVLILHTHTGEAYSDADEGDAAQRFLKGVIAVGESISRELNSRGVPTVHLTVIHDKNPDTDPYQAAADSIRHALEVYPTVKYVIDVHRLDERDESGTPIKTEPSTLRGTAQIRFTVSGMGRSPVDSLRLALCLRRELNSYEKRLCMPVVLADVAYGGDLAKYYLKVDVGALGNTSAEAERAGRYFAEALADLLIQ